MQHHAHVARTAPPHLRAHHMAVPPPHTKSQPHMPPLNLAHVPPPRTGQQPQQTSQQKQSQHLSNGPATAGTAAVISGSSIAAAPHVRDHHTTRLNQQPLQQHPSSMHSSTQLQQLRQQHQHINNNNNNNNNSTNKNNYHHHQASQYNNSVSSTHGNALSAQTALQQPQPKQSAQVPHHTSRQHQQQHQLHHQQQSQQQQSSQQLQHKHTVAPMPPQQSHAHVKHQQSLQHQQTQQQQQTVQTTNVVIAKNVINTHVPPPALPQPQHLQQQQQQPPPTILNYYGASNTQNNSNNVHKSKYNNNNTVVAASGGVNSGMPPKTILQNPNRVLKARVHNSSAANHIEVNAVRASVGVEETTKSGGNLAGSINNAVSTAEIVISEIAVNHVSTAVAQSTTRYEGVQNVPSNCQSDASSIDANKENMISATQNTNTSLDVSSSTTTNNSNNILSNEDNTVPKNSKEKTPMCLVNELARYNKITHQYRLTSEKGPAHCKRFTVTLKLGEEEYSAEGFKIKKAQHLAAAEAIEKTKYKHPVPKVIRRGTDGEGSTSRANITPTVELNALAMKLGQQTYYLLDPRQAGPIDGMGPSSDAMMAPRFNVTPPPPPHALPPHAMAGGPILPQHPPPHVRMMDPAYVRRNGPYAAVAPPQPQMHGHHAAGSLMRPRYGVPTQRAYMPKYNQQQRYPLMAPPPMAGGPHNGMLQPPLLPHPQHPHHGAMPHRYGIPAALTKVTLVVGKQKFVGLGRNLQQAKHDAAARALQVLKTQATTQLNEELNNSLEESDSKSPISLVYEIGIQRSLTVHFKVVREEGPAHMKKFVTACVVGTIVTEGEGNGKKISKKRAAEKMLEELRKLPPLTPTKSPIRRIKVKTPSKPTVADDSAASGGAKSSGGSGERRKRGSGSIKDKSDADNEGENPITRLIQLQQNRKEKEPVFELIAKNGNENSRRREFIIEVTAHGMVARGTGNSKKLAKRNAAQNLLLAMGEKDNAAAEVKSASAPLYAQPAVVEESAKTTNSVACKEQTNTVLQPIIEAAAVPTVAAATAVAAEAHLDVPLVSTTAGQVPGILILRHNKKHTTKKKESMLTTTTRLPVVEEIDNKQEELPVAATTAITQTAPAALPSNTGSAESQVAAPASAQRAADATATPADSEATSNTAAANSSTSKSKAAGVHTKVQLLYLAKLLGFEVSFNDFPKGNHSEFLTIVTLSSNPPQICHGMGTSAEESQNDAAKNALKLLSKLGLNNTAN